MTLTNIETELKNLGKSFFNSIQYIDTNILFKIAKATGDSNEADLLKVFLTMWKEIEEENPEAERDNDTIRLIHSQKDIFIELDYHTEAYRFIQYPSGLVEKIHTYDSTEEKCKKNLDNKLDSGTELYLVYSIARQSLDSYLELNFLKKCKH